MQKMESQYRVPTSFAGTQFHETCQAKAHYAHLKGWGRWEGQSHQELVDQGGHTHPHTAILGPGCNAGAVMADLKEQHIVAVTLQFAHLRGYTLHAQAGSRNSAHIKGNDNCTLQDCSAVSKHSLILNKTLVWEAEVPSLFSSK